MKSSTFQLSLLAAVVVLAIGNLIQFNSNRQLRDQLADMDGDAARSPLGKKPAAGGSGMANGTGAGIGSGAAAGSDRDAAGLRVTKSKEKQGGETFSSIAEKYAKSVQDNPAIQKQMLAQFEAQLGGVLDGLYEHFELEGDELSHFKGLIADHWRVQSQVPMQLMSAMGNSDKVAKIKEDLQSSREATDARIAEFLNDENDYAYFETYRDQIPDRMEVNQYRDAMEAGGIDLKPDQEAQLITAMAEEREASGLGDVNDPMQWEMEDFNEQSLQEVMDQMTDFHSRVQVRAGGILEQEQISALVESQGDIRQQQELGMRFGLQMMEAMRPKDGAAEASGQSGAP